MLALTRVLLFIAIVATVALAQVPQHHTRKVGVAKPQQPVRRVVHKPTANNQRKPIVKKPLSGDARALYYKRKSSHFYSRYVCDKKCLVKRKYFKIARAYKNTRRNLFALNKKLHHLDRIIAKYNKKILKAKEIQQHAKRVRLLRKYTLKKKRFLHVKKLRLNKRAYLKKKLNTLMKSKRVALNNLEKYLNQEIKRIAKGARKQRGILNTMESQRKESDAKNGNYWKINHQRLNTLRAEKNFRSKLYFKFKRDVHYLGALFRKRAHLKFQIKKQTENEKKYRNAANKHIDQSKLFEKQWNEEQVESNKAKLHTLLKLSQAEANQADRRVRLSIQLRERAEKHLKRVHDKLAQVVDKKITNIRVGEFPKRIIEQMKQNQIKLKETNEKLFAYNEKLIKKMEHSNSFFLLQPSRKDSRYVCTTTEDLVENKGESKSEVDPSVRNVLLRPLICFVKDAAQFVVNYNTNNADNKPLSVVLAPSTWRQTRLTFKNVGKKLQAVVTKSTNVIDADYQSKVTATVKEVDGDVRKYIATHSVSAKALVHSFFIERVPLLNEPFKITTNLVNK